MKKAKIYALTGIAAVAVVGGTFAYYNTTQTFNNQFSTSSYGTVATEKFNPNDGKDFRPGKEVDKEVKVKNTGNGTVWVRAKFSETWSNLSDTEQPTFTLDSKSAEANTDKKAFFPDSAETAKQVSPSDGETKLDKDKGSVVYKNFGSYVNWDASQPTKDTETWWFNQADGYFYYMKALTGDTAETKELLKSVTLCKDTDMGLQQQINKYIVTAATEAPAYDSTNAEWKDLVAKDGKYVLPDTVEVPEGSAVYTYKSDGISETQKGYAGANYMLDITVEVVQGDTAAAAEFTSGKAPWAVDLTPAATPGN